LFEYDTTTVEARAAGDEATTVEAGAAEDEATTVEAGTLSDEATTVDSVDLTSVKAKIAKCGKTKTDCATIDIEMASKAAAEVDRKLKTNGKEQIECKEWLKTKLVSDTLKLEKAAASSNSRSRRSARSRRSTEHKSFDYIKVRYILFFILSILENYFIQAYYKPFNDNDEESSYWNILPHTGEIFIGKVLNPIEVDTLLQFISINESK